MGSARKNEILIYCNVYLHCVGKLPVYVMTDLDLASQTFVHNFPLAYYIHSDNLKSKDLDITFKSFLCMWHFAQNVRNFVILFRYTIVKRMFVWRNPDIQNWLCPKLCSLLFMSVSVNNHILRLFVTFQLLPMNVNSEIIHCNMKINL